MDSRPILNRSLAEFGETIFAEMSALATATGAINLGQGFPDTDGPASIAQAAVDAILSGQNQYPPGLGIEPLRIAIAEHQRRFYGLDFDPDSEVLVTAGATEAIAAALLGLCEPGDEVITLEPYYDSYAACIAMAGARRRVVTLTPPDYSVDLDAFADAIGPRTRLLLINSPHNPTGHVLSQVEREGIARLANEHDLIVVTDEVYEHLVFDGEHVPLASLPGMRARTVTISSAGKMFSFTGWKIGWVCAPPPLLNAVRTAKQYLTFVNGAPFQPAIAHALSLDDDYFVDYLEGMRSRRDRFCDGLKDVGFDVFVPMGTYFVTADIRGFGTDDGRAFCLSLPERCGVVAVPNEVFYDNVDAGRHLIRFAFCKRPEVLDEAITRLGRMSQ